MTAKSSRLFVLSACALLGGLLGESLLFLERQSGKAAELLLADFRAVVFLKPGVGEDRVKVVSDKLRALGSIEDLRYVSRDEAFAGLRRADPELVDSIALLGENPLQPAIEARFAEGSVGRTAQWVESAYSLGEVSEIRYKSAQVRAILQAQFYRHFLRLILDMALLIVAIVLAYTLWSAGPSHPDRENGVRAFSAAVGAAGGMMAAYLLVWPLRGLYAWWAWPSISSQALLLIGAATAAKLFVPCKR